MVDNVRSIKEANQTYSDEFMHAITPIFERIEQFEIERSSINQQISALKKGIQADYHMNADAINDAYKYWGKTEQQKVNYDITYHSLRKSIGEAIQPSLFNADINHNLSTLEKNAAGDPENQEDSDDEDQDELDLDDTKCNKK